MSENPRVKAIEERRDNGDYEELAESDIPFLLEDRKRLLAEVKRIESYCTEVEIARRAAESEVATLKAQIADMRPRAISESEDRRCAVVCSYHPRYAVYKELGLEVRAALGAGEGAQHE